MLTLALERTCCQMAKELNGGEDVKVDSAYVITVLNIMYVDRDSSREGRWSTIDTVEL